VLADAERLRQILVNLLVNAIKFSNPGGEVTVAAERAGEYVRISISDTGIGIPADQLAHVFEPFYQVERGHLRRYAGVGLGLTISRELARAMGGDIAIESTAGVGTTVTLVLPAADVGAEATPSPVLATSITPADPLTQT
jgi:signal transduction histidine kinase